MNEQTDAKLWKDVEDIYKQEGRTGDELGKDTGLSPATVVDIKQGRRNIPPQIRKLMESLAGDDKPAQKEQ